MRACPHDVRQCLDDGQAGPHGAVEALLRLLRCSAEMINRPEERAARDCATPNCPALSRSASARLIAACSVLPSDASSLITPEPPLAAPLCRFWSNGMRSIARLVPSSPACRRSRTAATCRSNQGRWPTTPAIHPLSIDRGAAAEIELRVLELFLCGGELIRRGIEACGPQDRLGAEDVRAALLERVVGGEVADEEHDHHRGDQDADAAARYRASSASTAASAHAAASAWGSGRVPGGMPPRYPSRLTQTGWPRASLDRTAWSAPHNR